jgi:hypothetical protein
MKRSFKEIEQTIEGYLSSMSRLEKIGLELEDLNQVSFTNYQTYQEKMDELKRLNSLIQSYKKTLSEEFFTLRKVVWITLSDERRFFWNGVNGHIEQTTNSLIL